MKKYDWDKQLRKELRSLPEDERETILDYYNEIFEDKRDRGERETEIIASFGSPYAVAEKILRESRSGGTFRGSAAYSADSIGVRKDDTLYGFEAERPAYRASSKIPKDSRAEFGVADDGKKSGGGRVAAFIILLIIFWIPILAITVSVFAVLFALVAAFVAVIAAGGFIAVIGFIDAASGVGAAVGLVEIGAGVLVVGIGCLLCPVCLWFGKIVLRLFRSVCRGIGRWLAGRKAA